MGTEREVMTQNSVKSSSVDSGSVNRDKVRAEDAGSKVSKISQPIASGETVKKDSVEDNVTLSVILFYLSDLFRLPKTSSLDISILAMWMR